MLLFSTIWVLCSVATQTAMCDLVIGSSPAGNQQGSELTIALSMRQLLQDARPLVAGGQNAPEGRFPYACSLKTVGPRVHRCGGALIAPDWVLTAAHCLKGKDSLGPTPVVYVGAHGIDDDSYAEVILAVEVIIHERYTENVEDGFDIALVRLKKPSSKQPVAVAHSEQLLGGGQLLATAGWGKTSTRASLPEVLQYADQLQYVINKNCQRGWPNLKDSMICAFSNSQAACDGDSGGPLLIPDSKGGDSITTGDPNFDLLVGIVSYGPAGCDSTKADVYTRVSSFRRWIDEKMGTSPRETTTERKCGKECEKLDEALYYAAWDGESNIVKALISRGADVSATHARLKFTPLHSAAWEGHANIIELLMEAGANIDVQTAEGLTPLYFAAQDGHLDAAKVLVEAGATVDLKRDTGATPLHVAAEVNDVKIAEFLLESGANVNARNDRGETPLHSATVIGNPNMIRLFLDNRALIDAQDDSGETPILTAAIYGSGEAIEVFKDAGADLSIKTKNGFKIEDVVCVCLELTSALPCQEGTCQDGEKERIKAILED